MTDAFPLPRLFRVGLDGGEPQAVTLGTGLRLSERNLGSEGPGPEGFDISPEGDEVAFVADSDPTGTDTNHDVYLIPLAGGEAIVTARASPSASTSLASTPAAPATVNGTSVGVE